MWKIRTDSKNQTHLTYVYENGASETFIAHEEHPRYAEYLKWVSEGNTPLPAEENQ